MKKRYYQLTGFCQDCTGFDFQGCNDGLPFELGNFTTENFAFEAGYEFSEQAGPYYFKVEIIEVPDYEYDKVIFEK